MKIVVKRLWFWTKPCVLIMFATGIVVDIWFETAGMPEMGRRFWQDKLEQHGVACDAANVKFGIFRGLVVRDLTVWDGTRNGSRMLDAESLQLRLRFLPLLGGRLMPRTCRVRGGTLVFDPEPGRGTGHQQRPLEIQGLRLTADFHADKIRLRELAGSLFGVQILLDGEIANVGELFSNRQSDSRSAPSRQPLGWAPIRALLANGNEHWLEMAQQLSTEQLFLRDDAFVTATITIDARNLAASAMEGAFQLADISVRGVPVQRIKAHFQVDQRHVELSQAILYLGVDSAASGGLKVDLVNRRIGAHLKGSLNPHLIYRFWGAPMPRFMAETSWPTPPMLDIELGPSPLDPREWRGTCRFDVRNVVYRSKHIARASGELRREPGTLGLHDVAVVFDAAKQEAVQADVAWDETERVLSGSCKGTIYPSFVVGALDYIPPAIQTLLHELQFNGPPLRFEANLKTGHLDPNRWDMNLRGEAEDLQFRDQHVAKVSLDVALADGIIRTTTPARCQLDATGDEFIELEATVDPLKQRLAGKGSGAIFFNRVYHALGLPKNRALEALGFHGPPPAFTFNLEESPFAIAEWKGELTVAAADVTVEDRAVNKLTGQAMVGEGMIRIRDLTVNTDELSRLEVSKMDISLSGGGVEVVADVVGDPLALDVLYAPGPPRQRYRDVWKHFKWSDKSPPHLTVKRLHSFRRRDGRGVLELAAHLDALDCSYRDLQADSLAADLDLNLPRRAAVRNMVIKQGDTEAKGELVFDLGDEPVLSFTFNGIFNPVAAFSAINKSLAESLVILELSDQTQAEIRGSMHLRGAALPRLEGKLAGDRLLYRKLLVTDYTGNWRMVDQDLKWSIDEGKLYGGAVTMHGLHNGFFGSGKLSIEAEDVDLAALLTTFMAEGIERDLGQISGTADLDLLQRGKEAPLRIRGESQVAIRDGQLWDTPVLEGLGNTIGIKSMGRISSLDADLEFEGDKVVVPHFATNGTILALNGSGDYAWDTQAISLKVYGQALKSTSLIPLVLKPLSWFFEAELTGTRQEHKWRLLGPLRRMIPGED